MHARHLLAASLLIGILAFPADAGVATWVEAKSPNFTVYSDAGEKRARSIAWQFEQIRAALSRLWPWARFDFGAPVVVYAARDERSMRTLLPEYFKGGSAFKPDSLFLSAPDAHYVAVRADASTEGAINVNPYLTSYWSYVFLVLRSSIEQELPPWLARGLAEVFSNTIVREKEIQIGQIIPWHIRQLRGLGRPTVEQMLGAGSTSPLLSSGARVSTFDAMAWALTHYLIWGNQGKNIALFNEFTEMVHRGAAPREALLKVYGGIAPIREGFARYLGQPTFVYQKAAVALEIDADAFTIRAVPAAEAAVALARFHAAMKRPVEARAHLAAAVDAPAAAEVEATLLEREGKRDEARTAYGRASAAGAATFYGEYRFASLSWRTGEDVSPETLATIEKALQRSVTLNPSFAPAQRLLAQSLLASKRSADALPVAQRAVALDGRDAYSQLLVSRAFWGLSRPDQAMISARRALSLATTDEERRGAQQLIEFYDKASARPAPVPGASGEANSEDGKRLFDACNGGDTAACGTLSQMFDRACRAGDARGCMMTAFFLLEGRGVPRDEAKGMSILEPLCEGEMPEACMPIATVLLARGDQANRARARELLDKSCKAGGEEACKLLASLK